MIGDRCISDGHGIKARLPHPKINQVGNTLIGGCGNASPMIHILNFEKELRKLDYAADPYQYIWNELYSYVLMDLLQVIKNLNFGPGYWLGLSLPFSAAIYAFILCARICGTKPVSKQPL